MGGETVCTVGPLDDGICQAFQADILELDEMYRFAIIGIWTYR
jgi:hypothetical protein